MASLHDIGTRQIPATGERRRAVRARTLKSAKIVFNHQSSVVDCTVRNLTKLGALLIITSPVGVPDAFDLRFEADGTTRACRVIWRTDNRLGVEFG